MKHWERSGTIQLPLADILGGTPLPPQQEPLHTMQTEQRMLFMHYKHENRTKKRPKLRFLAELH